LVEGGKSGTWQPLDQDVPRTCSTSQATTFEAREWRLTTNTTRVGLLDEAQKFAFPVLKCGKILPVDQDVEAARLQGIDQSAVKAASAAACISPRC
jgi:hypothetical protein